MTSSSNYCDLNSHSIIIPLLSPTLFRKDCEQLSEEISKEGIRARFYHAGMEHYNWVWAYKNWTAHSLSHPDSFITPLKQIWILV